MSSADRSPGNALTAAARFDPQLQIPARPRVRRGVGFVQTDDQLVVTGTAHPHRFGGRSAVGVLPRLLELCDGSHDHDALAGALNLSTDSVFDALTMLWTNGVVEEGPSRPAPQLAEQSAALISRLGDTTGANPAWEDGANRLTSARVVLLSEGAAMDQLARVLAADGVTVQRELPDSLPEGTADLVVLDDDSGDLPQRLFDQAIPLVRFVVRGRTAHLGPYVDARFTACLECRTADDEPDERPTRPGDRELAVGLMARDLFSLLSAATPGPLPIHWRQVDLGRGRQERRSAPTRPGCPTCSVADGPVRAAPTTAAYEAAVAFPPKQHVGTKAHQAHYKPANLALQRVTKQWPVAARFDLPDAELSTPATRSDVRVQTIADVLASCAGIADASGQKVQRWSATGGNLGSVVAHVIVRNVPGIEPGTYGYLPTDHRLARLSARTDGVDSDSPATVVLTGHFTKVARKYGAFALRIVLLDAGCALTTAQRVAAERGLRTTVHDRWDDTRIAELLGTEVVEPVTAVLDLGASS